MVYVAVFWLLLKVFALFRSRGGAQNLLAHGAEIVGYDSVLVFFLVTNTFDCLH